MMKHARWISLLLVLCLMAGMVILPGVSSAEGLNKKKVTLVTGATFQLILEGAEGPVTWKSSSKKIAKVSDTGLVKASKPGKCTITAKAGGKTYKCKVTVKQGVKKIKLNKKTAKLKPGDSLKLKATVTPGNAANKKIRWESDNPDVATVSKKGVVKAVGAGTAVITATAADGSGKKAKCTVTVAGTNNYTLGSFSKFILGASFDSAAGYLTSHENDSDFWNLINESWIYEDSVTTIEAEGIFVFARSDAVAFTEDNLQPIRTYRLYDKSGKFRLAVDIDRTDDHATAVEVASRLNRELEEDGTDSWGFYGKTKHFACGNCLVTLEGIGSLSSKEYATFAETVKLYRDRYGWTIHAY